MREILFRGKRKDNGEWVEGFFVNLWMVHYKRYDPLINDAHTGRSYDVDPETVGQFTGLTDKNGKKIFEGDLVKIVVQVPEVVEYKDGGFFPFVIKGWECEFDADQYEVVGNIHDNPELLEERK